MTERYQVIIDGAALPGVNEDTVRLNLAKLLKSDTASVVRLLSGKPVTVKRDLDEATAERYREAIERAGARCRVAPDGPPPEPTSSPPVSTEQASTGSIPTSRVFTTESGGDMILTNIESVPGKRIVEHFGLVSGSTIRAKHVGRDIMASFKNLIGGEIKSYTKLLQDSRAQATSRMVDEAEQLGANAIVNVRYSTSSVAQGAAELYAYGTAIRVAD